MLEIDPTLIADAKLALSDVKPDLPEINGRNGNHEYGKTKNLLRGFAEPDEAIANLPTEFLLDERLHRYLAAVIRRAFDYQGEGPPSALSADLGVIGASGQQLDYLHTDPYLHSSWKLTDITGVNPSTRITAPSSNWEYMEIEGFYRYATDQVPEEFFGDPVPEGCGSMIKPKVYHGEYSLPSGSALMSVFATFK